MYLYVITGAGDMSPIIPATLNACREAMTRGGHAFTSGPLGTIQRSRSRSVTSSTLRWPSRPIRQGSTPTCCNSPLSSGDETIRLAVVAPVIVLRSPQASERAAGTRCACNYEACVRLSVEQRFHTKGTGPRHPAVDGCRQGRLEGGEGGTLKRSMATSRERRIRTALSIAWFPERLGLWRR